MNGHVANAERLGDVRDPRDGFVESTLDSPFQTTNVPNESLVPIDSPFGVVKGCLVHR